MTARGVLVAVFLLGCGARTASLDPAPRADAGAARDAGTSDAGATASDAGAPLRPDGGVDAGPADLDLGRALTCDLDAEAALRALVRHVACDVEDDRANVVALMEGWEAGLLSHVEESGGLIEGLAASLGCEAWRCAADAADCAGYADCVARARREGACEPFEITCDGATLRRCDPDGAGARSLIDCARFGAVCEDGRCRIGECAFGADYYHLACDGDALTLCDGARRLECDAWNPGSACASFHIGGEVPTQWCSPSGMSEYGAYSRPVDCDGRTIRFVSVSTTEYTLDCVANGYSGCDERGCVP